MFERKTSPLLTRKQFIHRIIRQIILTLILLFLSLIIGILGYHSFEGLSWIDSLLNASMILGGMGEITELQTNGGKLFASFYAIYSGVFLIVCGGLLLAPVFHRILHYFHSDDKEND